MKTMGRTQGSRLGGMGRAPNITDCDLGKVASPVVTGLICNAKGLDMQTCKVSSFCDFDEVSLVNDTSILICVLLTPVLCFPPCPISFPF